MNLDGTTALVTGASGGIGAAIARALRAQGARLVLTGRRADAMAALAAETGARVLPADLADRDAAARLLDDAGDIDVLVANAALPASGHVLDFSVAEIDRALEVNLRAPVVMARIAAEAMARRGRGHLVFVSSIAGRLATAASSIYSATKFGLRGFALGARADLAPRGVGVSAIYPGFVRDAGMFADTGVKLPRGVGSVSPTQVADAVVDAITDNRAEIVVASWEQRLGAFLGGLAPDLVARVEHAFGADKIAGAIVDQQRHKR
jgi:short-subunit dehydrogenase